jgi:hypothetical protein
MRRKVDAKIRELCKGSMTVRTFTIPLAQYMQQLLDGDEQEQDGDGDSGDSGDQQDEQQQQDDQQQGDPGDEQQQGSEDGDEDSEDEDDGDSSSSSSDGDEDGDEDGEDSGDSDESSDSDGEGEEGEEKQQANNDGGDPGSTQDESDDDSDGMRESDSYNDGDFAPFQPEEHDDPNDCAWHIPKVEEPALTGRIERPGVGTYAASDKGRSIRRIDRVLTDGRVFGRKRTRPGTIQRGTFLVDVSSSMMLTQEQLENIVHNVPGATVAVYNRLYGPAYITVVARNGKVCDLRNDVRQGGTNSCDGPALVWLSRQPGPRFWYSDGEVNGKGRDYRGMQDECFAICKQARITHITPFTDSDTGERNINALTPYDQRTPGAHRVQDHGEQIIGTLRQMGKVR